MCMGRNKKDGERERKKMINMINDMIKKMKTNRKRHRVKVRWKKELTCVDHFFFTLD